MSLPAQFRRLVFGIPLEETTVARRGFCATDPAAVDRLEQIGRTFVQGYHTALEVTEAKVLGGRLDETPAEWRGFAYEGAAMALALLDLIVPFQRGRWEAFLTGPGDAHAYMVHVGLGWAAARIPWVRRNLPRYMAKRDPLLRWLVVDGYGFHEGYFHAPERVRRREYPLRLSGYARRAFDQGLGRSLWFVDATDPERVEATIAAFPLSRRADLWSGIGLAATYAGGADRTALSALLSAAGDHRLVLAQGAAFAAKARLRAGDAMPHTELACEVLCGTSAATAAAVTDQCLAELPPPDDNDGVAPNDAGPDYERWRRRIQTRMGAIQVGVAENNLRSPADMTPE